MIGRGESVEEFFQFALGERLGGIRFFAFSLRQSGDFGWAADDIRRQKDDQFGSAVGGDADWVDPGTSCAPPVGAADLSLTDEEIAEIERKNKKALELVTAT